MEVDISKYQILKYGDSLLGNYGDRNYGDRNYGDRITVTGA